MRPTMADLAERMARNLGPQVPQTDDRDKLSADALIYVDLAASLQRQATTDPTLNGADVEKRYRADD